MKKDYPHGNPNPRHAGILPFGHRVGAAGAGTEMLGRGESTTMPNASAASAGLFVGLVLVVGIIVVLGLRRAGVGRVPTVAILLAYVAIPGLLARLGILDRYDTPPAPAPRSCSASRS